MPKHRLMDLSIIIVNWNSVELLRACITSVQRDTHGIDYEIIVIDAASFDGCDRMLHESFPTVRFIQSQLNVGFGQANNKAFEVAHGESVLFLNPDTEVVGPAISTMHAWLQRLPMAGAVGCRLLNGDSSLQTSCVQSFPTITNQMLDTDWLRAVWPSARLWGTNALYADDDAPKLVEAIAGACVMLKKEVFERVGRFSKEYFMYAEDIDLCHKANALGLHNYYVPEATVIHYGGGSSQKAASNASVVLTRESICRFLTRTRGRGYAALYRIAMLNTALLRLAIVRVLLLAGNYRDRSLFRHSLVKRYDPTA
jgi:N-acetylglucosaminyl-diphospho-decaprenol L-rhamnosyltransferase